MLASGEASGREWLRGFSLRSAADHNLCELDGYLTRVSYYAPTDLNQATMDTGQRPVGDFFGQLGTLQEAAEVVDLCVKLKADLIVTEPVAG